MASLVESLCSPSSDLVLLHSYCPKAQSCSLQHDSISYVPQYFVISRFLPSRVFADKEAMMAGALEMAGEIAGRSPVAVQGTKINLVYSRDHSVAEGLDYMVRTEPCLSALL